MSERLQSTSVNERVRDLNEQRTINRNRQRLEKQRIARELVVRMSNGEPFDIDAFIFAGSMGNPEQYIDQKHLLEIAESLPEGSIVGLHYGERLEFIGLTAEKPLLLTARDGLAGNNRPEDEQLNRNLEALLLLTSATGNISSVPYGRADNRIEEAPFSAKLLISRGEPEGYRDGEDAFYNEMQLLVGADAVIDFVTEQNDENGKKQIAKFMTELTASRVGSLAVSRQE